MNRRFSGWAGLLAALVLGTGSAIADGAGLRGLATGDDSRGWEGVGRLDLGGGAFCTGALIAENLVLTAAHCLFDKTSGARIAPETMEFRAGWRNGRASAYRGVRRALAHPGFAPEGEDRGLDVALIELNQPIRNSTVLPFAVGEMPRRGAEVGVVSYAHDRAEMPSLEDMCHVLGRQSGTLVLDCDVDFGSSGAPVFDFSSGSPRIVSVVSAKAMLAGKAGAADVLVSLGTSLTGPLADLNTMLAEGGDGVFTRVRPTVTVMGREDAAASTGAKFVRP